MFDLINDVRDLKVRNFVAGRWVLTAKRDKDGNFVKCKARSVLKGFQNKRRTANKQTVLLRQAVVFVVQYSWQPAKAGTRGSEESLFPLKILRCNLCQIAFGYGVHHTLVLA